MFTKLQFAKLRENAKEPVCMTDGASGFDLSSCSADPIVIKPQGVAKIPTGIAIALPPGYTGKLCSRSSLSFQHELEVGAGVIDSDYRGHIYVLLYNRSLTTEYEVFEGDRIAQLLIQKVYHPKLEEVTPDVLQSKANEAHASQSPRETKGMGNIENK